MKPLNSDMMVGKSAFKQIQDKEINSKYPIIEKEIFLSCSMQDILTIFYLSWRSHQLSVQQVHQEFKPIAGQRRDSAQLHQWAGS